MKKLKLWDCCLLVLSLMILTATAPTVAVAAKAKSVQPAQPAQPISIEADELYFSEKTGEMFARGSVVISQGKSRIFADLMRGNDKQADIWIDGRVLFQEPLTTLTGMKLIFHYATQFGTLQDVAGKCGDLYLSGRKAELSTGKYTLYDSTATTCKMKGTPPDFRITAAKVEIWPGDKLVAHQAKVWVKNTVLYSTSSYESTLKKNGEESNFPRFGFKPKDGVYIGQRFTYPVGGSVSAFMDATFYSKAGFRPIFGLMAHQPAYTMELVTGLYRDENDNWVRKEPEFHFALKPQRIGKLPYQYKANVIFGKWRDGSKESWHQDYNLYVSHDKIYFDPQKTWTLDMGGGMGYVHESYDNTDRTPFKYNIRLTKKFSPFVTGWTGYNYNGSTRPLFAFGRSEVPQEGILGLSWQITNRTKIAYRASYDVNKNKMHEHYYTVRHSFHCWETEVTYRAIKREFTWTFTVARW